MTISNVNGISFQTANSGGSAATDSVSKSLQNQIANAQKQLQDLAASPEMTPEDKMKRRQEIQQEITALNQQLRQHQIDQRKEQQAKKAEKTAEKTETTANGMSKDSMQAMISAESAMKQAKVQGSVATKMEGRAGILKAEIKQDAARGGDVEKKQKELAEVEQKAQAADAAQLTTLAQANQELEGAAQDGKAANSVSGADQKEKQTEEATGQEAVQGQPKPNESEEAVQGQPKPNESEEAETNVLQHVDIRL